MRGHSLVEELIPPGWSPQFDANLNGLSAWKCHCGYCHIGWMRFRLNCYGIMGHRGYTTKMVVGMMPGQPHVVCYIKEVGGFLDYNHRSDNRPVIASDGSLEDIAGKVASDFRSSWPMTSFFLYRDAFPVYLDTVFARNSSPPGRSNGKKAGKFQITPGGGSKIPRSEASPVAAAID